jgi:polyhydroxyalkanoate synthase
MAPSNFIATNPEVLQTTLETGGENLLRGLTNLLDDLERGRGQLVITMSDLEAFRLGENVATTPGKVIFQNELMQLIQYAPSTVEIKRRPLIIVPPWINKFYVLDLRPETTVAITGADSEFSNNVMTGPRSIAKEEGFKRRLRSQLSSSTDYSPIVRAIQATNPDAVFVASYPLDSRARRDP